MSKIEINNQGDSLDKALRKLKIDLKRSGKIDAMRNKEHYAKPSERRRKELEQAIRREKKRQREQE